MTYKSLVVHLDPGARSRERLALAFEVAGAFDAHLVGLFAQSDMSIPAFARALAGPAVDEAAQKHWASAVQSGEAAFRAALSRHPAVKTEWRPSRRDALDAARLSARYADLVIAGQRMPFDEDDSCLARDFVEELVLTAGRPVLLVPWAGRFGGLPGRVLVAWNGGREAARAVVDALPLLQRAESVQVAAFNPGRGGDDHGDIPGADIGLYLARHGVKVSAARHDAGEIDVGAQILSRAADMDAELIVMGAYGHSRTHQIVLGGVTRTILESMTVPVLMSH